MEIELNSVHLAGKQKAAVPDNYYPNTDTRRYRVSVFGAGYVGCVSCACLSRDGFAVIAVDPDRFKVERLAGGEAPIVEPGLNELLQSAHASDLLSATHSAADAITDTDISFCCVGTPSLPDGTLNTNHVRQVCEDIGKALRHKAEFHIVVMRSTILPGTMEELVIPTLEKASGKIAGRDFGIAYYPEFLRESTAIADHDKPGAIVFGQYGDDMRSIEVLKVLVGHSGVTPHVIPMRSAEIVKYANNCWHAVKISFSNEIGNICKAKSIDSHVVMDVLCSDTRLNISRAYMTPGFAYGGSCLPKDLRALTALGRSMNVPTPVLDAARLANIMQIDHARSLVEGASHEAIGFIGVTFKADTDDLRESPLLELVEGFLGKGKDVSIYDPNVARDANQGRNFLKHIAPLLHETIKDVIARSEVIVVGNKYPGLNDAIETAGKPVTVIDLARIDKPENKNVIYHGLCW
ncbi:GDP-mannose dehydrogenase [Rhizobium sp. R72]|uniref:nucleotide sugar dehydrogenase n=1 Tax=unclassified Rhizobium TaxID=2613769 RepID=UPI000B535E7B|nr:MULTISPECIES: nucleotide sugar dehydrogenase [unclassified Rhizobium]OWV97491.1 GDP-mannose dehydrogenase [Rhizobium sp. R72]OWV97830.1 GDP-mannose dehydrogenase [Rhizobium sp. R711]